MLDYLKYPLWTIWRFLVDFRLAVRNTGVVLTAFWRTAYLGRRTLRVLRKNRTAWSERTRGRYIWKVAQRFWARWILEWIGARVGVEGLENVDWSRPHVVVANHQSTLDILLITAVVGSGRFVAKKEVLDYPFVGPACKNGGQIVIDRGNHAQAMGAIRAGMKAWSDSNLIFFAEGNRTQTGDVNEFKKGAFAIAKEVGLPILPVAISGSYDALPKGSLLRLIREPRLRVEFASPIESDEDVPALTERTRDIIAGMVKRQDSLAARAYSRVPSLQAGA